MADAFESPASDKTAGPYPHRTTVFFHLFFRSMALLSYLFCSWFSASFVMDFVVIVMLLAFDFWTVKNVSGRLLVGLRWWNKVKEDGTTEWIFESKAGRTVHPGEERIFWWSLYLYSITWVLFAAICILKLAFGYFMLTAVALSLNVSNVVGYTYCSKDMQKKMTSGAAGLAGQYASGLLASRVSGMFSGGDTAADLEPPAAGLEPPKPRA